MLGKFKGLTDKIPSKKSKADKNDQFLVALDIGTEFVKALIAKVNGPTIEIVGVRQSSPRTCRHAGGCYI